MMYLHPLVAPFHMLALIVLIAGEVRTYRSQKQIWRLVGLPLVFVLIPYLINTGRLLPLFFAREFFVMGWPVLALVWGALQLLKNTEVGADQHHTDNAEATVLAPPAKPEPVSASMQTLRVLLFSGGLLGVVVCLILLALLIINTLGYGGLKTIHLLLWGAALVNYGFYALAVSRKWTASNLIVGGVIVHLHLLFWVPQLGESPAALVIAALVVFGLLTYTVYTRMIWRQEKKGA